MMKFAFLLLCTVPAVFGYAAGPPVANANLCTDMIPTGHNNGMSRVTDQDSPPYNITTTDSMYRAGGSMMVTINGTVDLKGFFIQARRADPSLDNDVAIGTFSAAPANTQLLMCHTVANSAWAHSSNAPRSSVTATWNAPAQYEGPLEFKATIVKAVPGREDFYLDVRSAQFSFSSEAAPTWAAAATTPSSGGATTSPSSGCMQSVSVILACLSALFAFIM